MYVSRIEITGFKSFVDPTVIELQPGITAIVGPNGCGKTNICDAIRWVFGEENIRLLRGSRIEDVIFNGTQKRQAVGMAEVSITLSDVQGVLPVEQNEITVTRRVFRSGDSEFMINKVPCRLKDIVDLFLGTGLGRRAYSVMERDMIDWILDDTNNQRRRIIEEAAGISKYKARRQETINKLALTERDLERLSDLMTEIERRVSSLSRQAAKARRYERLTQRIREVEIIASAKEFNSMQTRLSELAKSLEEVEVEISECSSWIDVAEAEIQKKRNHIVDIDAKAVELGKGMSEVNQRLQKVESDIAILSERKSNLMANLEQIRASLESHRVQVSNKKQSVSQKRSQLASLEQMLSEENLRKQDLIERYQKVIDEIRDERSQSVVSVKDALERARGDLEMVSKAAELRSHQAHLKEMISGLKQSQADYVGRLESIEKGISCDTEQIHNLRHDLDLLGNEIASLAETIENLRRKIQEIDERRKQIEKESSKASSHYEVLKDLVERYEGYRDGVRVVMQAEDRQGVLGVVGDFIKCLDTRYQPAVITALAEAVEYVMVEDAVRAAEWVKTLRSKGEGSAGFIVLERVKGSERSSINAPGILGSIVDFIECEPRYRSVVDHLLGEVYLVESLDRALELSAQFGDRFGFVTIEGDAVFRGSIVKSALNGPSHDSVIGRRQKLAALKSQVEALHELANEQEAAYQEVKKGLEQIEAEYKSKIDQRQHLERNLSELEHDLEIKISEKNTIQKELAEIEEQLESKNAEIDRISKEIETLQSLETKCFDPSALISEIGASIPLEEEAERLRVALQDVDLRIAKGESNLASLREGLEQLSSEIKHLEEQIDKLSDEEVKIQGQIEEIERNQKSLWESIEKDQQVLSGLEEQRNGVFNLKHAIEGEIEDLRKSIKDKQRVREQGLVRRQEIISQQNMLKSGMEDLKRRMLVEYNIDLEKVSHDEISAVDDCEAQLTRLKEALRSLGAVNLVAIEDYNKEKERYDFLLAQKEDLEKARQDLNQAIVQINRKARAEFRDTFERVRQDFRKNFQILFEGGDADLRLRFEDDPLESPIDIFAQPSGKRLGQISLLSGGERALTAIAFLFAVYHTKPSPFCLLDEVDAPLDDTNIRRFLGLIREMSQRTQFVIVTHNKKTMEAASCLYGVTMEEPGVSKVVSVKLLSDAERLQAVS